MYTYMHTFMSLQTCEGADVPLCVYIHTHVYIHAYIHAHTHTYIYTCIHTCPCRPAKALMSHSRGTCQHAYTQIDIYILLHMRYLQMHRCHNANMHIHTKHTYIHTIAHAVPAKTCPGHMGYINIHTNLHAYILSQMRYLQRHRRDMPRAHGAHQPRLSSIPRRLHPNPQQDPHMRMPQMRHDHGGRKRPQIP